jgi:hypothetical protein
VAAAGGGPAWGHACAFPVCTDARLLRFLRGYRLSVTVLDDDGADGEVRWPVRSLLFAAERNVKYERC